MLKFLLWWKREVLVCLTQKGSLLLDTELCEGLRDAEGKILFWLLLSMLNPSHSVLQYISCLDNLEFNLKFDLKWDWVLWFGDTTPLTPHWGLLSCQKHWDPFWNQWSGRRSWLRCTVLLHKPQWRTAPILRGRYVHILCTHPQQMGEHPGDKDSTILPGPRLRWATGWSNR